ncbi:protein-serine,threonine phosphatase [Sarracenia purpurea var. burkii]
MKRRRRRPFVKLSEVSTNTSSAESAQERKIEFLIVSHGYEHEESSSLCSIYFLILFEKLNQESRQYKRISSISKERSLKIVMGSFYILEHNQNKPLGEDAYFIFVDEKRQVVGIADGVGGWARMRVHSGKYARELIANSVSAIKDYEVVDPMIVLYEAFVSTETQGCSTAGIFTLTPNNQLKIMVIDGDIIVAGTDRFFDNLHDFDIEEIVKRGIYQGRLPPTLASDIANFALIAS